VASPATLARKKIVVDIQQPVVKAAPARDDSDFDDDSKDIITMEDLKGAFVKSQTAPGSSGATKQ
jgi:hypothetical protein